MAGGFISIILAIKLIAPKTDESTAKCSEKLDLLKVLHELNYWLRIVFPPPRDLSILGIKPLSPALIDRSFISGPSGNP